MSDSRLATPLTDPPRNLSYPLSYQPMHRMQGVFGIILAFLAFFVCVPLVSQIVFNIGYLLRGSQDAQSYMEQAIAFQLPEGMLGANLGLASLIVIALVIARYLHGRRPRWVFSVQPGIRWRFLAVNLLVALIVLNAMFWIGFLWQGMPSFHWGGDEAWVFALFAVLSGPLQATAEEVFFRGYLIQSLGSTSGLPWLGVVGSALLFAVMHGAQNPALFAHRFSFGILAGWLVVVTGGLEAGIAAHVVNNLGAFGYAIFTTGVAEARALQEITWMKAGWDIAGYAICAGLAYFIARKMTLATTTA